MFKQDDPFFPDDINRAGCNLFSLLALCEVESETCTFFTKEQVLDVYHLGISTRFTDWQGNQRTWIEKNCSVVSPDAIAAAAFNLLGSKKKALQVGQIDKNGKPTYWDWANKKPYNNPEYILLEFPIKGEFSGHYVLADPMHNVLFDPSSHNYTNRPIKGGLLYKVIGG